MSFLKGMDIAASGMTAQRLRMDVIAENIANIETTRNADGEPYRRRFTVMSENEQPYDFASYYDRALGIGDDRGVKVVEIEEDDAPFKLDYNPSHPDANEEGYVEMPNVDLAVEMVDMIAATRSYEANVTASNAFKTMALKALEI